MTRDDLRATVESVGARFDLSEYEIEAYLTTLEHGSLTASDLANRTDVPQPRVYDTVRSLADKGLVELRESRPLSVVAIDPAEAFESIQDSVDQLVADLAAQYTAPADETEAVTLVTSAPTILRYIEDVISAAENDLVLSLTPSLLERFEPELRESIEQGVGVDVIVSPAADAPNPDTYQYDRIASAVRLRRGVTTPILAVADGEYAIYASQDALESDRDRYAVIFNRSALGNLVSGFFDSVLWRSGTDELANVSDDRPYPRTYTSVRRCVEDVLEEDGEWYATVEGRDIETGEDRRVSGRISDLSVELNPEIASFSLETDRDRVTVGGRLATVEDVEARRIRLDREKRPTFS
ncbi:HTH-type sugar sensing transcriptional regulator TrmB [Halovivax gelatinilyticus]|uniref:HTH-type sugar sensing transcriptional regulator TrmB n=1 Tax=Halovivax gelatinilyticus TaxID=2961597 RepID=UPI0020CA2B7D|nr:TrmB family transcriptional regulator [Halovivax gelatinilyticus]